MIASKLIFIYSSVSEDLFDISVPIVSSDNSWWIASENVLPEVLPEIKEEKTSGVKYIFTTRKFYIRHKYEHLHSNIVWYCKKTKEWLDKIIPINL